MKIINNIEDIKDYLLKKKIKPSYQRIKILKYLMCYKNHPTVDMIYTEVVKEIPTLSKTTIYNTLNLFIEENIARMITIEEGETRYDATVESHGHFKCRSCEEIFDFKLNDIDVVNTELKDFIVEQKSFYFTGLCEKCIKNK